MTTPGLDTALQALLALDGTWRGSGEGYLPSGDVFTYSEDASFAADEERRLVRFTFEDRVTDEHGQDVRASHVETGIIRLVDAEAVEILSAQTGRTEVLIGSIEATADGCRISVDGRHVGHDPRVAGSRREYTLAADALVLRSWLTLASEPDLERLHTVATLQRTT